MKVTLENLDDRVKELELRDKTIDNLIKQQAVMEVRMDGFDKKLDTINSGITDIASNIQEDRKQRFDDMLTFNRGKAEEIGNTRWAAVLLLASFMGIMAGAVYWTSDNVNQAAASMHDKMDTIAIHLSILETRVEERK